MNDRLVSADIYDLKGKVRLITQQTPWQHVFHMNGVQITKDNLAVEADRRQLLKDLSPDDLDELFQLGFSFMVQIDHDDDSLPSPFLKARLVNKSSAATSIQLVLKFEQSSTDLDLLLERLAEGDT